MVLWRINDLWGCRPGTDEPEGWTFEKNEEGNEVLKDNSGVEIVWRAATAEEEVCMI